MLSVLQIKNLAIVSELEVELGEGLNVLTGETGAGKSIILRAVELLRGWRSSGEIIRSGATECEVEGFFELEYLRMAALIEQIEELDSLVELPVKSDSSERVELVIRRVIRKAGRGKAYINGKLVPLALLQRLGEALIDITAQHYHQILLATEHQRAILDSFGAHEKLLKQVGDKYQSYCAKQKELDDFLAVDREKSEYLRRISFEVEELSIAALQEREREKLEAEQGRLGNVERIGQIVSQGLEMLGNDREGINRQLRTLFGSLEQLANLCPELKDVLELVETASVQLDEADGQLQSLLSTLEADPARLEDIRSRISEISRLERKYDMKCDDLLAYFGRITGELEAEGDSKVREAELRAEVVSASSELKALENELGVARKATAQKLCKFVDKELAVLGMKKAKFNVSLVKTVSSAMGADKVEFLLAANPGEPFRPLSKVASGGELSRIVLVLKTLLSKQYRPTLQVFDEVDVGVGGAIAEFIGEKLRSVSKGGQVLIVTHAPQVAAFANNHLKLRKISKKEATQVSLASLDEQGRVLELARMLAGKKISARFEESARELMRVVNK